MQIELKRQVRPALMLSLVENVISFAVIVQDLKVEKATATRSRLSFKSNGAINILLPADNETIYLSYVARS